MTVDKQCKVASKKQIAPNVWEIVFSTDSLPAIKAGQFCNVQVPHSDQLILRRPFCIVSVEGNSFEIVFAVKGEGTQRLSQVSIGESVNVLLPLGNGFDLQGGQRIAVVGGGMGVLPLLSLVNSDTNNDYYTFLGFCDKQNAIKVQQFERFSKQVTVYTDDGSLGRKGFVTSDLVQELEKINAHAVVLCGPHAMLNAVKQLNLNIPVYVCLEQRMACGVGVCVVCTCAVDGQNKRVCKDGPVFLLHQVQL